MCVSSFSFLLEGNNKESGKHDVISNGLNEEREDDWLRLQHMHLRYGMKESSWIKIYSCPFFLIKRLNIKESKAIVLLDFIWVLLIGSYCFELKKES